jgi:anti-sigma regulatory factor (Ser/Thr protein kinase)
MERVFYNLLVNAAQATAPGGAVTVKTRAADGNAEISVIDRGVGIDPKLTSTIFNPFSRPSRRAWAWVWPSALKSWISTAARSRSRANRARAACSASICP